MKIRVNDGSLVINDRLLPLIGYTVLTELGEGANARVYKVKNKVFDRYEALKIWLPRNGRPIADEQRFYAEIRKNAQFTSNDTIATIYTGGVYDGICYCLMEYCPGVTLKSYLSNNPSWLLRWGLARQISDTLKEVYEKGYYHGDLHSRNIIYDHEDEYNGLKILDMGTSLFSGKINSQRRDAELLYKLSFEMIPCLRDVAFYNDSAVSELPSPMLNKAFRSVINLSMPESPEGYDIGELPPESKYLPPDYSKTAMFALVHNVIDSPFFKFEKVEKFIDDFSVSSDGGKIGFYKQLFEGIEKKEAPNGAELRIQAKDAYERYAREKKSNWMTKYSI